VAIWQHRKRVWAYFYRACAETAIKELPVKNLTSPFAPATSIFYMTDAFPLPSYIYWIKSMFCATTSHDLVTLIFDLLTLRVSHVQCFSCLTHIPIFIILWLSVTELRVLNIWSTFRYLKQSLRMRRVTWPLTGAKIVNIFEIPDPNLPIHFVTFTALRR